MLFFALLIAAFREFRAAQKPFTRKMGTPDYMNTFGWPLEGFIPVAPIPIYAHECVKDDCSERRFLTMRYGNNPILQFSNFWSGIKYHDLNGWHTKCPKNMLAMGMSCSQGVCGLPQLHCGLAAPGFKIVPRKKKTVTPLENETSAFCPDGMYVQGLHAANGPNYRSGLHCVGLFFDNMFPSEFPLIPSDNKISRSVTLNVNDNDGYSLPTDGPIFSIICSSHQCQAITLVSVSRGIEPILGPVEKWTNHVGYGINTASCPPGMLIKQMRCRESYCNKINLGCARPTEESKVRFHDNDLRYSNVFGSYVSIPGYCPEGYYAKEVNCPRAVCSQLILGCVKATYIE